MFIPRLRLSVLQEVGKTGRTAAFARATVAAPITAVDGAPLASDPELTAELNAFLLSPR